MLVHIMCNCLAQRDQSNGERDCCQICSNYRRWGLPCNIPTTIQRDDEQMCVQFICIEAWLHSVTQHWLIGSHRVVFGLIERLECSRSSRTKFVSILMILYCLCCQRAA